MFLALLSHFVGTVGLFKELGDDAIVIRQFTRMATPLFVFMFGFMVEFNYARQRYQNEYRSLYQRLLVRSFQCYAAYAITSLCAVVGGYHSLSDFFASLLFFSNSRFGNILRVYSLILLITPLILSLRKNLGVKFLYITLTLLIISYAFIERFYAVDFGAFNFHARILFGVGPIRGGPSVYGALSFFLAGMIMASGISVSRGRGQSRLAEHSRNFYFVAVMLSLICIGLGWALINDSLLETHARFSFGDYRRHNDPAYYIIGILTSVSIITFLYFFIGSRAATKLENFILTLGTSSLISYTAGNAILNLFGPHIKTAHWAYSLPIFYLTVILISQYLPRPRA